MLRAKAAVARSADMLNSVLAPAGYAYVLHVRNLDVVGKPHLGFFRFRVRYSCALGQEVETDRI